MRYFGTDGIRGKVGGTLVNAVFFRKLGYAAGEYLRERWPNKPLFVVLGRDTRQSGEELSQAVIEGLCAHDIRILQLNVVPTPAVAHMVVQQQAALGIVITASHNPVHDNGIKFFDEHGHKLTEETEADLETRVDKVPPDHFSSGHCQDCAHKQCAHQKDGRGHYATWMKAQMDEGCLRGWKIVLDTANGATAHTSPSVLRHYGAEVITIGDQPDGSNINDGLGSEHPEVMAARVRETGARLGIAHDGDGDRLILADQEGSIVDGDEVLGLLALHENRKDRLTPPCLVATVQSNVGLDRTLAEAGVEVARCAVGDRNVFYEMAARNALLGGENSGHVVCRDAAPTGDGLLTALRVLRAMLESGRTLSELRRQVTLFPQKTKALRVAQKLPIESLPSLPAEMRAVEAGLGAEGRILVRYSGTEPKLRLLAEAPTEKDAEDALTRLINAARADLQVEGA